MDEQKPLLHSPPQPPPSGFSPPPPLVPPTQGDPPPLYQAGQPVLVPPQTLISSDFGETPVRLRCPNCQNDVVTTVKHEAGMLTWLIVFVLFLIGCCLCCWIPLCIDALKDIVHTCPNCKHTCGVTKKMG